MIASWILVFSFTVPDNPNFNKPVFMDSFATQQQCESTLMYIALSYKQVGITGSGYCWGEQKND